MNDTVMLDLESGKIKDFIKFEIGQLCMATAGSNRGRVGTIVHKEKHKGSFDIVLIRDSAGQEFATRWVLESSRSWGEGRRGEFNSNLEEEILRRVAMGRVIHH